MFGFVEAWPVWLQTVSYIIGLCLGVFCLVKFCDYFVDASCVIAKKLNVSPLIIGLTIVAMGTSLPELAVSVFDSVRTLVEGGNANLAIGNVVGSNICNLLLVLGFSVVFTPIVVKKNILKKEFPILLGVSVLVVLFIFLFGFNGIFDKDDIVILRWEGAILVVGIVGYITYLVISAKKHPEEVETEETKIGDMSWGKAIFLTVLGAAGIILGGTLVNFGAKGLAVEGAVAMGLNHDLAEALVALTVVAVGTSLPELVTSTVAAKKGQNEIALGNVIGSNIFNSLFVLGIAGAVSPLTSESQILFDVIFMLAVTILVFVLALKGKLNRKDGIILLSVYALYLVFLIMRTVRPDWFAAIM